MNTKRLQFFFVALFCAMAVSAQGIIGKWNINGLNKEDGEWVITFNDDETFSIQARFKQPMEVSSDVTITVRIKVKESGTYDAEGGKISLSMDSKTLGSTVDMVSDDLTQEQKDAIAEGMKDEIHKMNQSMYDYCKKAFEDFDCENLPYNVKGNVLTIKDPNGALTLSRIQ